MERQNKTIFQHIRVGQSEAREIKRKHGVAYVKQKRYSTYVLNLTEGTKECSLDRYVPELSGESASELCPEFLY